MTLYSATEQDDSNITIASELTRKTLDTIELALNQRKRGELTEQMFYGQMLAINSTTRGLIDVEINLAVDELLEQHPVNVENRLFMHMQSKNLVLVSRELGETDFFLYQVPNANVIRKRFVAEEDCVDPVTQAFQKFQLVIQNLTERKGFEPFGGAI